MILGEGGWRVGEREKKRKLKKKNNQKAFFFFFLVSFFSTCPHAPLRRARKRV